MQMALWAIAPSPLFFGGDLTRMDAFTYSLLTNADLLWLNNAATKSEEIRFNNSSGTRIWRAQRQAIPSVGTTQQYNVTKYVGVFNTGSVLAIEDLTTADFGAEEGSEKSFRVVDVWTGDHVANLRGAELCKINISSHDVALLKLEGPSI